ncbi:MAG: N-acetylmuramoyl-L-alanine amidase, partial [Deltaproteobacteria bacterium]|nr:N-acetylmuramoyl-L-alanine amidase [Deltaproteobacteria bacterium]
EAPPPTPKVVLATPRPTASPRPTPPPTPEPTAALGPSPVTSGRRYTIVLDPGHGGQDPGARGVTGEPEKSVTLAIVRQIDERLKEEPDVRVLLTREDDRAVPLEQRTAIANAQGADLFLSIHANGSGSRAVRGIETYTLNNTQDQATIRLAALENGLTIAGAASNERDLAYILSDLLQTGKEDESQELAQAVQEELVRYLRGRWEKITDLGVKKGPFYVLVGAYMPCVLVEVGFLTNEEEGHRIGSPRYQRDLAEGITRGIRRFIATPREDANL